MQNSTPGTTPSSQPTPAPTGSSVMVEKWRRMSQSSFTRFCLTFLAHRFTVELAPFHRDLMAGVERLNGTVLDTEEIPRQHAKTTIRAIAAILWLILTGRKQFALLTSESATMACKYLRAIKVELEVNQAIRDAYGDLSGVTARVWHQREVELSTGQIILAAGKGQSCRGLLQTKRPDFIVVDDPQKLGGIKSHSSRENDWDWVTQELIPAGDEGNCDVLINQTRLHRECVSAKAIRKAEAHEGTWTGRTYRVIEDGKPLWPGKYTMDRLAVMRANVGDHAWAREYLNDPKEDTDSAFQESWLVWEGPQGTKFRHAVFMDPAKGKEQGDYTAVVWVQQNADGPTADVDGAKALNPYHKVAWVRQAWITRRPYSDGIRTMAKYALEASRESCDVAVGWEPDQYGAITKEVRGVFRELGVKQQGREVKHSSNKNERIIATLQPPSQQGKLRYCPELRGTVLIDQLLDIPLGSHDDGPDALEGAWSLLAAPEGRIRFL